MDIQGYVSEIRALYSSGQTTEHSFRPALAKLFGSVDADLTVINEPKHITDVGAPDSRPRPTCFARPANRARALRRLHLMEPAAVGDAPYPFNGEGAERMDCVVDKPTYDGGPVTINATQYFDNVPAIAWDFHIGGYQPAQNWLKDRKGRALSWDDIRHDQTIIKILAETDRIMREIELPLE